MTRYGQSDDPPENAAPGWKYGLLGRRRRRDVDPSVHLDHDRPQPKPPPEDRLDVVPVASWPPRHRRAIRRRVRELKDQLAATVDVVKHKRSVELVARLEMLSAVYWASLLSRKPVEVDGRPAPMGQAVLRVEQALIRAYQALGLNPGQDTNTSEAARLFGDGGEDDDE